MITRTTPIIIETTTTTRARLALVSSDGWTTSELRAAYNQAAGRRMSGSVHTRGVVAIARLLSGRDATPADLERAGWVKREVPSAEAWKAAHAEAERELIRARAALAEQPDPGTLAHLRADLRDAVKRAEYAEQLTSELQATIARAFSYIERTPGVQHLDAEVKKLGERAEKAERERDDARRLHSEAEAQVACRNELRAQVAAAEGRFRAAEAERDTLRTDLDAERRRADAIERANVELHEKLAQADRELDGACSPDCQARIDYVEADNAKLRVELARLTAPGEGEPTDNELRAVWDPEPTITAARRALFRAGVAHERARHGACCPLDPDMPVEAVDADLRAAGVDPEALARFRELNGEMP